MPRCWLAGVQQPLTSTDATYDHCGPFDIVALEGAGVLFKELHYVQIDAGQPIPTPDSPAIS